MKVYIELDNSKRKRYTNRDNNKDLTMTASEKYTREHNQLKQMLKDFEKQLELHSRKFKQTGSTDWSFVGDLDRFQNQIGDVLIPLKDSL